MRQMLKLLSATVAFGLSFNVANAAEIQTARGPVVIEDVPSRVVVYDIAAMDTLDALGVKPVGLPSKIYVPELQSKADGVPTVGDLFEPDLEALNELTPDLIIVGSRTSAQFDSVSRVAKTIDMTIGADNLIASAKERLKAYGELLGRQRDAEAKAKELDSVLAATRDAVKDKGKALILMTNGPKVSAFGPHSRFGWIHEELGLQPAAENIGASTHGEAVSFEFVHQANPDWLIVVDRAAAVGDAEQSASATLDNELVAQTTAWKKGQVIYLPPADFYIAAGGVQATTRLLNTIKDGFSETR